MPPWDRRAQSHRPFLQLYDLGEAGDGQELADQDDHQRQHGNGRHAGGQPAQPFGTRKEVTYELIGPQADSQRNQHTKGAEEDAAEQRPLSGGDRRRRFGGNDVRLVEDIDFRRDDHRDIGLHCTGLPLGVNLDLGTACLRRLLFRFGFRLDTECGRLAGRGHAR